MLVAIQVLDGIGAGIFGVVSVLVIADLTRGTGRFNLTLGAITTAVGIGAALSQVIAGTIVHHVGSDAGFLFLAVVALAGIQHPLFVHAGDPQHTIGKTHDTAQHASLSRWRSSRRCSPWWSFARADGTKHGGRSLAAAAMLVLGLVTPREAIDAILAGKNTLLFLLSLLALSFAGRQERLFRLGCDPMRAGREGNAHALYRNAFVAGAIVTAILSLDTTAVMLTPVLLALVKRLKVPAAPYVVLCAFVANVGSLLLPISNLTNLLFADAFRQTFAAFAARMIVPQLVALVATYAILRWHFRRDLPSRFEGESLPEPASVSPESRLLSHLRQRPRRRAHLLFSCAARWGLNLTSSPSQPVQCWRWPAWPRTRTHSSSAGTRVGSIPIRHRAIHRRAGA